MEHAFNIVLLTEEDSLECPIMCDLDVQVLQQLVILGDPILTAENGEVPLSKVLRSCGDNNIVDIKQ